MLGRNLTTIGASRWNAAIDIEELYWKWKSTWILSWIKHWSRPGLGTDLGQDRFAFIEWDNFYNPSWRSRRGVMLDSPPMNAYSAMLTGAAITKTKQNRGNIEILAEQNCQPTMESRDAYLNNIWCTYCKKPRNTKEKCRQLHEKPPTSSKEWGYKAGQQQNLGRDT